MLREEELNKEGKSGDTEAEFIGERKEQKMTYEKRGLYNV